MYKSHLKYEPSSEQLSHQFLGSGNTLGIGNTNFIWDQKKGQLILIMETDQMVDKDIRAFLKGNSLFLEAPLLSSYSKPIRTHHMGRNKGKEFEEELTLIGVSEIKLKHGYQYHLVSCQAIDWKMIKVILGFTLRGRNEIN